MIATVSRSGVTVNQLVDNSLGGRALRCISLFADVYDRALSAMAVALTMTSWRVAGY